MMFYCSGGFGTTGSTAIDRAVSASICRICPCISRIATDGSIAVEGREAGTRAGRGIGDGSAIGAAEAPNGISA